MKAIIFEQYEIESISRGTKDRFRIPIKPQPRYCALTQTGIVTTEASIETIDGIVLAENGTVTTWDHMPYRPDDILYIRETFLEHNGQYCYKADGQYRRVDTLDIGGLLRWHSQVCMPLDAARLFLQVDDVQVSRIRCMTAEDATRDFCRAREAVQVCGIDTLCKPIWDSQLKPEDRNDYGWDADPWVYIITFHRVDKGFAMQAEKDT